MKLPVIRKLLLLSSLFTAPVLVVAQTTPASAPAALSPAQINEGVRIGTTTIVNQALVPADIKIKPTALLANAEAKLTEMKKTDAYTKFQTAFQDTVSRSAPKAADLIKASLKDLKIADSNALLTGSSTAITDYLRKAEGSSIREALLPIVKSASTGSSLLVKAREVLNTLNPAGVKGGASAVGELEDHITKQLIAECFKQIAQKEAAVRKDPTLLKSSPLAQKVFESVKK